MIRFKDTVDFRGMTSQIGFAIERADEVNRALYRSLGEPNEPDTWITSICDDAPGRVPGSKHRTGEAVDFSIHGHPSAEAWRNGLAIRLGPQFQVILHDAGTGQHLHIEFDPPSRPVS